MRKVICQRLITSQTRVELETHPGKSTADNASRFTEHLKAYKAHLLTVYENMRRNNAIWRLFYSKSSLQLFST